jgi:hypothetical protein
MINEAIEQSNFEKALGPDGFDGRVLKTSKDLKRKIAVEITKALNNKNLPTYLRRGRLVSLSKVKG